MTYNIYYIHTIQMTRNYRKEYDNYQGKPEQIANRSSRNTARRKLKNSGYKLKGKDVDHKDGNPKNNSIANLRVRSKSSNRSRKQMNYAKIHSNVPKKQVLQEF